jgi:PAS domain S-box-containing protein
MVPTPDKRPAKSPRRTGRNNVEIAPVPMRIPGLGPLLPLPRGALQTSTDRLRLLVDNSPDLLTLLDSTGRIVYAAPALERVLGWKLAEIIGVRLTDLTPSDGLAELTHLLEQAKATPARPFRGEVRALAHSGAARILDMTVSNHLDEPTIGAIVCNAIDVSAHKDLHARLMLSDRMASLGTLAASVAHEINNPLAALIGNLQLLADDLSQPPFTPNESGSSVAGLLKEAQEAAERVRVIARDLNLFSRREQDTPGFVDVQRLLDSSLRMSRNELRHRARVVKHYEPVPPVYTNEARLGQIFVNLLVNAAQAIPEGRADDNEVRVSTRVDDHGNVVVDISDTGGGISPELLGRVFDPFFTTKPLGQGTGLGLAICRRIVSEMGGSITVTSTLGSGSTFTVALPMTAATDEPRAPKNDVVSRASKRGKVLIIDDEALVRTYVARALGEDHEVVTEASAKGALARVRSGARFDAIICDVMMPDVTGIDFYEQVARLAPEQGARVIFLTGGAFSARARRFLETTVNPVIEKPFEPTSLRSVVNRLVG